MSETRQAICPPCETANPVENRSCCTRGTTIGTARVLQAIQATPAPKERRRSLPATAAVVAICMVLGIIAAILGGCGPGKQGAPPAIAEVQASEVEVATEAPAPTEPPVPTEAPNLPKLGDVLEQDGYSLSAVALENPASVDTTALEPEPGTIMVAVEFVVGNVSAEPFTVDPLNASIIGGDGSRYPCSKAQMGAMRDHKLIATTDIWSGEGIRGWIGFVLPAADRPAYLQYEFDPPSGPTLKVGLTE